MMKPKGDFKNGINIDLRKKYLGATNATDEDMRIVQAVREYVDIDVKFYMISWDLVESELAVLH